MSGGKLRENIMKMCHQHTILIFNLTLVALAQLGSDLLPFTSSCSHKQTHFLHSLFGYKMLPFVCVSDVGTIKGWTQIEKTLMCFNLIMRLLLLPPLAVVCLTWDSFVVVLSSPFSGFGKKSRQTVCWATHGANVTTSKSLNLRVRDKFTFKCHV